MTTTTQQLEARRDRHGQGQPAGHAADGKPVRWNAVDIYRVTDGKISEEWAADDIATIMAQLGVFSPPWAA